jgi:hypothetical protein
MRIEQNMESGSSSLLKRNMLTLPENIFAILIVHLCCFLLAIPLLCLKL